MKSNRGRLWTSLPAGISVSVDSALALTAASLNVPGDPD